MNYLTDERQHALSSEYVLGSLHGSARVRFQRLLMQHNSLRRTLWHWESRLNELGGALPEVQPAPEVWERIQTRLGFTTSTAGNNVVSLPQRKPRGLQWLAGLSAAAAILMAVLLVNLQPVEPLMPGQIAVVQSEKAQALWLIEYGTINFLSQLPTNSKRWIIRTMSCGWSPPTVAHQFHWDCYPSRVS